jgi:hypothetical protein
MQDFGMFEGAILWRAIKNIPHASALPARGLDVSDILKHEGLVMMRAGLTNFLFTKLYHCQPWVSMNASMHAGL